VNAPVLTEPAPVAAPVPVAGKARHSWWVLPPLVLMLVVVVQPLVAVLALSGRGGAWGTVLSSAQFQQALLTTVLVAVSATAGCLVLGSFVALVLAFVPFPGHGGVSRLIDSVLSLPSFVITLAFVFLYGATGVFGGLTGGGLISSTTGVILAEITFFTPFVVRPLLAAFARFPREQLDVAASLGASPGLVLVRVLLPEALPALAAGGGLTLLLTLNEFGIVLFTGARDALTLPTLIYTRGIVTFDLPGAAVIATVQVVLSLLLYAGYRTLVRRVGRS
jgi:2-aminoethylphosphonate transport system permease protein